LSNESVPAAKPDERGVDEGKDAQPAQTRRSFLGKSGRRALYMTPVILSLTARQAKAASVSITPG